MISKIEKDDFRDIGILPCNNRHLSPRNFGYYMPDKENVDFSHIITSSRPDIVLGRTDAMVSPALKSTLLGARYDGVCCIAKLVCLVPGLSKTIFAL